VGCSDATSKIETGDAVTVGTAREVIKVPKKKRKKKKTKKKKIPISCCITMCQNYDFVAIVTTTQK
jgi:hypothetical protein